MQGLALGLGGQGPALGLGGQGPALGLDRQGLALAPEAEGQGLAPEGQGQGLALEEVETWTAPLEVNDVFAQCQSWQHTRISRQVLIILVDRCRQNGGIKDFILQLAREEAHRIIGLGNGNGDEHQSACELCQSFLVRFNDKVMKEALSSSGFVSSSPSSCHTLS